MSSLLDRRLEITASIWSGIQNASTPADRWLGNYFHSQRARFGASDRRFYAENIYALFRHKIFLEAWVSAIFPGTNPKFMILIAAVLEDLVPENEALEFSHQLQWPLTAEILKRIRAFELPPGFKTRGLSSELALKYSFPLWLVEKWIHNFSAGETEELLKHCRMRPPFTVRVNPVKITREALIQKFQEQGFEVFQTPVSPYGIIFKERANLFDSEEFREGLFEVQDEGSQILCQTVDAKPGELVWDVCAGGGGKTLLMAAMMQNKGRVVATDIRARKLDELAKRAKRAGLYNIFPADLQRMNEISAVKKGFDKILVDAPCSGTGTLRRNPDAKWKISAQKIEGCVRDQLSILENALPYLKKGGKLYYATCSLEPEENEEIFKTFLERHPELSLFSQGAGRPFLKLFPHQHQTDGFFLAIAENK